MTAAGLAFAIPAVLAYNVLGRLIGRIEADLEGFAICVSCLFIAHRRPWRHEFRPSGTHIRSAAMSEINMTPLIDVMLVLVVIFIMPRPCNQLHQAGLPKSDAAKAGDAPKFVMLVIDKAGQAYLDDKAVQPDELARNLTQIAGQNPETEVQLRADEAVPYGRVVEVMGAAQKAGLNRIGFVADAVAAPK